MMRKPLFTVLMIAAIMGISASVSAADEYTSNADIDYSYDANYDESVDQEETTSKRYDDIEESYSSDYDEADGRVDYYGDELEEPVYYDDYSSSTYNNENEVFEEPYEEDYNNSNYYNDDIMVFVDDYEVVFDVPPQIINDRTMVPLRAIFEALGAEIYWYDDIKAIEAYLGNTKLVLYVGSEEMYKNGQIVMLDSPPVITNGRTLVPVRAIAEGFNCTVNWDNTTRTVNIQNNTNSSANYLSKTYRVGISPDLPPMEYYEDGHIVGFDIDLIQKLSEDLGFNYTIVDLAFDQLMTCMINDDIDIIISSYTATDERMELCNFTDIYYSGEYSFYGNDGVLYEGEDNFSIGVEKNNDIVYAMNDYINRYKQNGYMDFLKNKWNTASLVKVE